jgi:uncharacterized Zn finger protein
MTRDRYPRTKPRRRANGIRAKTQRGQDFGKTWWAGKWLAALEHLVDAGRLSRGRSYARSGQVLNIDIKPGTVTSRVQGSVATPYRVTINVTPLDAAAWNKVCDAMAAQAIFAAKLLAGEMPPDIEEAFSAAGVSLFPTQRRDLQTNCSCPDWSNPCKHVAAVYYLLGEQFDDDPFLLLRLRGRTRDQLSAALRARRTAGAEPDPSRGRRRKRRTRAAKTARAREKFTPLSRSLDNFWSAGDGLDELRFAIAAPEVEAATVRRLGEPPFWSAQTPFLPQLSVAYRAVTEAAIEEALGEA